MRSCVERKIDLQVTTGDSNSRPLKRFIYIIPLGLGSMARKVHDKLHFNGISEQDQGLGF